MIMTLHARKQKQDFQLKVLMVKFYYLTYNWNATETEAFLQETSTTEPMNTLLLVVRPG